MQSVLVMLFLIIISNIFNKRIPNVSVPVFQIILGMIVGLLPLGISFHIESELFMLIFIAPLLFKDGINISNRELWEYRKPIISLVLGLVLFTVICCGFIMYYVIPGLPLAAAFALAAVLSPTDAVSVKAISKKAKLPERIQTIVEGESLLNDASGLVAFNLAIAAVLTGVFTVGQATASFIYMAIGGIIFGVVLALIINFFKHKLQEIGIEDTTVFTLIQIITPFIIFAWAEHIGLSPIVAVVSAGITQSIFKPRRVSAQDISIKYVTDGTWTSLLFVLNGLVFIYLGMELPLTFSKVIDAHQIAVAVAVKYVIIMSAALFAARFLWVISFVEKGEMRIQNSILTTLTGVRGAITLAAAFSIPFFLHDGSAFPQRDLIIFICGGTIIVFLAIANILLPICGSKFNPHEDESEDEVLIVLYEASLALLKKEISDDNRQAATSVIARYDRLVADLKTPESKKRYSSSPLKEEIEIFNIGIKAELAEVHSLMGKEKYSDSALHQIEKMLISAQGRLGGKISMGAFFYYPIQVIKNAREHRDRHESEIRELTRAKVHTTRKAIEAIRETMTPENEAIVKRTIDSYLSILEIFTKMGSGKIGKKYAEDKKNLEFRAIQAQKEKLQDLLENGDISYNIAGKIREAIRFEEVALLEEDIIRG